MSTVLPVIQPELNAQPRTAVDFDEKLAAHGIELRSDRVDILQVNVGKSPEISAQLIGLERSPPKR